MMVEEYEKSNFDYGTFSSFLGRPFVNRVKRRDAMRTLKFVRSTCDCSLLTIIFAAFTRRCG